MKEITLDKANFRRLVGVQAIISAPKLNQIDPSLDHWFYNHGQMLEAGSGES